MLTCWAITEGHAGMENQCVGLAEALNLQVTTKRIRPRAPWKYLPTPFWPAPLSMIAEGTTFSPPWPDVIISCGRRSVAAALAIKRASNNKTFAVHIQDPYVPTSRFDALIVPEHDRLRADNILTVRGAMHRVTQSRLDEAASRFAPMLKNMPHPIIAVLVGGSNRRQDMTAAVIEDLSAKLREAVEQTGGSLAITPSRRTGKDNEQILRDRLNGLPLYVWDGATENPYFGLLALADTIVVTSDSVSMVTEACITGKPVYVHDVPGASRRLQAFLDGMERDGLTRPFLGKIEHWSYSPLNETVVAAEFVRKRLMTVRK